MANAQNVNKQYNNATMIITTIIIVIRKIRKIRIKRTIITINGKKNNNSTNDNKNIATIRFFLN